MGRYVLEGDVRVDVLIARQVSTVDAQHVTFEGVWTRRRNLALTPLVSVPVPTIDDLIATKRFAMRPKDAEDIRMLTVLKEGKS
jgi:hypothetical protein